MKRVKPILTSVQYLNYRGEPVSSVPEKKPSRDFVTDRTFWMGLAKDGFACKK